MEPIATSACDFISFGEKMTNLFVTMGPDSCELVQHYATTMLDELGDEVSVSPGQRPVDALWAYLKNKAAFAKLDHRIKQCQFMASHRATKNLIPHWTEMLFKTELLCLEQDFFVGKSFVEKIVVPHTVLEHAEDMKTTSSAVTQAEQTC